MQTIKHIKKRRIKASVISDLHLGTYGCKAPQILDYLKGIDPEILVLNGDIVDGWQFTRSYFPPSHLKVVRQLIKMMEHGTKLIYVAGNHDEVMRRFSGLKLGNFSFVNKVVLKIDGKKSWIFHGDVFDVFMHHSKWLARLGAKGYGMLTIINKVVNGILSVFGKKRLSISKSIKERVKGSGQAISRFERTVAGLAVEKEYDYVICGHIHTPADKTIATDKGEIRYLNSGDWVENLTALEYENGEWQLKYWEPHWAETEELATEESFSRPSKAVFISAFREVIGS
ncbi:UDP-2,3-diacylglucosamine diphosphatase [Marinilabilia sp.]|jgi:UDP-2,3-diacylglucosamine pyrophosphatase LpxH